MITAKEAIKLSQEFATKQNILKNAEERILDFAIRGESNCKIYFNNEETKEFAVKHLPLYGYKVESFHRKYNIDLIKNIKSCTYEQVKKAGVSTRIYDIVKEFEEYINSYPECINNVDFEYYCIKVYWNY